MLLKDANIFKDDMHANMSERQQVLYLLKATRPAPAKTGALVDDDTATWYTILWHGTHAPTTRTAWA